MTLFIQGLAIPLDTKNVNGWGIPSTELNNVLSSLKASQLRICPDEAHACDVNMDPFGRIGHIVDAWEESDGIHAKAEVTDSIAARKLQEGTWNNYKWSLRGNAKIIPKFNDGWDEGVTVKAMTLVKNPAYSNAQYQIAASEDEPFELQTFSEFQLIASDESLTKKEGDPITEDLETKISELRSKITELENENIKLTASVAEKDKSLNVALVDVTDAQTQLGEAQASVASLTASIDELKKDVDTKTTLIASLEKEREGKVNMDTVETLIAAAIEKHDAEKAAEAERQEAFKLFASALGIEAKIEDYQNLSASDFRRLSETVGTKLEASAQIKYQSTPAGSSFWTVGRPDNSGGWRTD